MGEWKYSSTILDLGSRLQWVGQLEAPDALGTRCTRAEWVSVQLWTFWSRKKSLVPLGN
jgi:hypothetical protein